MRNKEHPFPGNSQNEKKKGSKIPSIKRLAVGRASIQGSGFKPIVKNEARRTGSILAGPAIAFSKGTYSGSGSVSKANAGNKCNWNAFSIRFDLNNPPI